jgi:hypothetical protein
MLHNNNNRNNMKCFLNRANDHAIRKDADRTT